MERDSTTKTTKMAANNSKEVLVTRESTNPQFFEKHLKRCFEGEKYADIEIICQGVHLKANRSVLASASPTLRNILKDYQSDRNISIIMAGFTLTEIQALLEYAYTGDITCFSQNNVDGFQHLADIFSLEISNVSLNSPEESLCIFNHFLYQSDEIKFFERERENPDPSSAKKKRNSSTKNSIQEEKITQQFESPESVKKRKKITLRAAEPSEAEERNGISLKSELNETEDVELDLFTPIITLNEEFQCDVCHKNFPAESRLKQHKIQAHRPVTPVKAKVKCGVCGDMFLPSYLKRHMSRFHSKSYSCTVCNIEFTGKKSFLRHQVIIHKSSSVTMSEISSNSSRSKIKDFIDDQDTTLTMTPATSAQHTQSQIARHKSSSKSKISSISSKSKTNELIDDQDATLNATPATSTSAQRIQSQIIRHKSSPKSKISSISSKSKINDFIDDQDTTLNVAPETSTSAEHTQNRIKCNVCDKTFRWESRLKEHKIAMHSPKSPIKDKVKCDFCDGMFLPGRMKMHIAHVHSKLYTCTICQQRFTAKKALLKHTAAFHKSSSSKSNLKREVIHVFR